MDFIKKLGIGLLLMIYSCVSHATGMPLFTIVPKISLPTTVIAGETTRAVYTVTSNSSQVRTGFIRFPILDPAVIAQVTSDPNYRDLCDTFFTLKPGSSCTLEFLISGAVNWDNANQKNRLFLCYRELPGVPIVSCAGTNYPLNVTLIQPATPFVAVGSYSSFANEYAGVTASFDNGASWVSQIIPNLPGINIPLLVSNSCVGNACVAAGSTLNSDDGSVFTPYPFIAYSANIANTAWQGEYLGVPAAYDQGHLFAIDCPGNTCIAVGEFIYPNADADAAIEMSTGDRTQWTFQALPPLAGYLTASLAAISCMQNTCIAVGESVSVNNNLTNFPIITTSNDQGRSWQPIAIFPLPTGSQGGTLKAIKCVSNQCITVGESILPSGNIPAVNISTDGGNNWTVGTVPPQGFAQGIYRGVTYANNNYIAVGDSYNSNSCLAQPVISVSSNGGASWVQTVLTLSPGLYGFLNGVKCNNTTCIAVGYYEDEDCHFTQPLGAISVDGGTTWSQLNTLSFPSGQKAGVLVGIS